ncbi:MAG: hypothetical protein AAGG57_11230 [Pseudomonadota bacterium]
MDQEKRVEKIDYLKSEFCSLIDFHAISFKDIENKARYWLTVTLPSFFALLGYLINDKSVLDLTLMLAGYALLTCLAVAIYYFSSVLISVRVESGVLVPPNRDLAEAKTAIEDDEKWVDLVDNQLGELLRTIKVNEAANSRKSQRLSFGECSLFRAAPTATVLAAASAFLYTATSPLLSLAPSGTPAGAVSAALAAGAGFGIGAAVTAAFLALRNRNLTLQA